MRRTGGSAPIFMCVIGAVVVVVAGLASAATASSGSAPAPRWPAAPGWQHYITSPTASDVIPVRVVARSGSVTGATTLTRRDVSGRATLTMKVGGPSPSIVVDFGQDVGGVPYFVVRSEKGSPVLHAAYAEARAYLGPDGDGTASASAAGDDSRADDLIVADAGTLTTGLIQGGERFERISLTSPGMVTLSSVGVRFTALRVTAKDYRGWFASSSAELNRIWYDGAYTTQLNELPAGSVPAPWRISDGALEAVDGTFGLLDRGSGWTDEMLSFDTKVADTSAGWLVRASTPSSGYLFLLDGENGSSPDSLLEVDLGPDEYTLIGKIRLPATFDAGLWHHVQVSVGASTISTAIDGRTVASFATGSLPPGASVYRSGTVGFVTPASAAWFRNLKVTAPGGGVLFTSPLSRPTDLDAFPGPNVATPDPLAVIMDGARRDRVVWSGDLGVEIPNVLDTTDGTSFIRGSLQLLGSYQVADGESGTNVDPTDPLAVYPQTGITYSTSYSMDEVDNIATYYLYTGDLPFVRSEWPMITRELAYNASLVDARGLLVTDATDGQDWDYYDGNKTGEVTAYNDIYYETLLDAGSMAAALGLDSQALAYRTAAANLRVAINRNLFDPSSGLYVVSNQIPTAVAQDGNALAVLDGVAPGSEDASILATLETTLPSTRYGPESFTTNAGYRSAVSPFVTNEEVQALFATGATSSALSLLQTVWGYMDGPGPFSSGADWELVGAHGRPGFGAETSLAHGWASGATATLSGYVLGVLPSTAGFRTWSVRPHPGTLSWAEGDVPTPHGTVDVRWAQDPASGRLRLQVTAPARTRGTIAVPVPRSGAKVTVRSSSPGRSASTRVVAASGVSDVPLAATGGATYDIVVTPTRVG